MAGRRGSTGFVVGVVGVVALVASGNAAQPPGSQPSAPPATPPGAPDAPPAPQELPPTAPLPGQPTQPGGGPGTPIPVSPNFTVLSGRQIGFPTTQRFTFKIDPKTLAKDLLPTPPAAKSPAGPVLADDLSKVPEADFQAVPGKAADGKAAERVAHQLAKINHLNAKKPDAFMAALLESRDDLAGLPFAMGDACRSPVERMKHFTRAVALVRQSLGGNQFFTNFIPTPPNRPEVMPQPQPGGQAVQQLAVPQPAAPAPNFWVQFASLCEQDDAARTRPDKAMVEHVTLARIAALTQMLAAEPAETRLGLVKYLTAVPHAEATKVLARMAIFSAEDDVRNAAITALKVRREKDYTDVLVKGLRYPWPAVAKRTADAIARLDRPDLIPELVAVLDETDPRLPAAREAGGTKVSVVRELVRVNHHRNCMMCHAPADPVPQGPPGAVTGNVTMFGNSEVVLSGISVPAAGDGTTAQVPVPGQPLPSPSQGYGQSLSPDLMIRIDVTYLRQDFSAALPVPDAHPWPENQRFDFFVRERKLTTDEAEAYRAKLTPKEAGVLSPYHKAALAALREMTGKDTAPTAEAWRKLLDLPKAGG